MKAFEIKASDLDTNCWLPMRHIGKCWDCGRYHYCSYPELVRNKEYDKLLAAVRKARVALAQFKARNK